MKRMHNFKIIMLVLLAIFFSCSPAGQISVSNVNDSGFRQSGSLLYSLPQTVIDVSVEAEVIEVIPGPYRQYAEKYLGIKDVPVKAEYYWTISSVQVRHHTELDPDYVYAVSGSFQPDIFPDFSKLTRDSMILDLSKVPYSYVFYNSFPVSSEEPYFTDLSVKRNFEAEKDIEVSLVMPDSNYLTRPSSRNRLKDKTLEQKAEEAANFIIKLKKRRFKLVSGQPDAMPNGEAMAYSLTELSRLEENYLSLFMGRRSSFHHKRTYHFTPVSGKKNDRIVLFRFSESEGFLDARETRGKPVMLDIANNDKIKGLEQTETPFTTTPNTVLYRIPDQVGIKLIWGESILSDGLFPVFQSGALVRMKLLPVDTKK